MLDELVALPDGPPGAVAIVRRSGVVSVNEQTSPDVRPDVFAVLSRAYLLAACAALGSGF